MAKEYVPYDGVIVTRKEAKSSGFKRYFTGIPCKYGHISQRDFKYKKCLRCQELRKNAWMTANPHKKKEYYNKSAPENRARCRDYYYLHQDKLKEQGKIYNLAHREEKIKASREWREKNRERHRASSTFVPNCPTVFCNSIMA